MVLVGKKVKNNNGQGAAWGSTRQKLDSVVIKIR